MPSKSRGIALGGILGAICILSLYAAAYLPTNRIFFYGLSSVFCGIMLIEAGIKHSWVFYGATSLLSFFVIPNKIGLTPYILFFGIYGIIKYYIEQAKNLVLEIILKGTYFILSAAAAAIAIKELFGEEVYFALPVWLMVLMGLIAFYLYDYVYSLFISYYIKRFRKR